MKITIGMVGEIKGIQLLSCLALIAFLFSTALGQEGSDLGNVRRGFNNIEGRIYYPSGRPVDKRLKITLQSINVIDGFAFSNEQGEFVFRRLSDGTYRITIDAGKEFETHSETVNVIDKPRRRGDESETIWPLTVFLKPKRGSVGSNTVTNAALAGTPKPAMDLYEKAGQAVKEGDKQKAIDLLQQALNLYPQFAEAYKELGFLFLLTKNNEKAVSAFAQAVKIAPDSSTYRMNLGYALLEDDRPDEAKQELLKAVELDNKSTSALILLGRAQMRLKDFGAAEKALLQVVSLDGADIRSAYRLLGALYDEKGDMKRTAEFLDRYLSLTPNEHDANVLIKLARAQIKLRKLDDAEKNLLQVISIGGPEISMAHRFLGALYNEKGDTVRTLEHLEKYLELEPKANDAAQIRVMIEDLRRRQD